VNQSQAAALDNRRSESRFDVLLLDFGGVCLVSPMELHAKTEGLLGLEPGTLDWLGPIDPDSDELWRRMVAGDGVNEREYWHQRAADIGRAAGRLLDLRQYMNLIYDPPTPDMIRPGATAIVTAAREAGYGVSVLTNDLTAFHGPKWADGIEFLKLIDHLVDCSDTGILKPDPGAYAWAVEQVGVAADRILFVDDQPLNIDGAVAAGLATVWFDIADPVASWREVAGLLDLKVDLPA
jgi:putative hydrolase of the HAD superfamily